MKRIVIIDDEEDLCLLMKSFFTAQRHEVHVALSLKEGMGLLERVSPDVLFLDNNLPDGLGWDSTHALLARMPHCIIHLMSAFSQAPAWMHDVPRVKFLEKPFSLGHLRHILS